MAARASRFEGWFAGIEKRALKLGDYSIAGLEDDCVIERKDLSDLVHSLTTERSVFVNRLRLMSSYAHRLLVITAALSEVESPYTCAGVSPNSITQSLVAALAGRHEPFRTVLPEQVSESIGVSRGQLARHSSWPDLPSC